VIRVRRWSGCEVSALRDALCLTKRGFAAKLGVSHRTVANWENGEEMAPFSRTLLDQCLANADHDSVQRFVDLLAEMASQSGGCQPDTDRVEFVLDRLDAVDLVVAAQLREQIQRLDQRYESVPSAQLLAEAGQRHGQIMLLQPHAKTGRVRRELITAEAESALLMGQLVWDASQRRDHTGAATYFDRAVVAARQVGDTVTEANGLLHGSYVSLYGRKDPQAGLQLAAQAALVSRTASHVLTGLALLHVGEAHAMLSARQDCEQALSAAETEFDQIDATDEARELHSPTQLGRVAGSCYLSLGQPSTAQRHLGSSMRLPGNPTKASAITSANLALACIRQRSIDEAVAHLHAAIGIVEQTRGAGGLNVAFTAGRDLQPWHTTAPVREVLDRLMTLAASD
jgi:hypothetical protein